MAYRISDSASTAAWRLVEPPHFYPGFALGFRYPGLRLCLTGFAIAKSTCNQLWHELTEACPALRVHEAPPLSAEQNSLTDEQQSLTWLLEVWRALQEAQGLPVYECGRIMAIEESRLHCVLPVCEGAHRLMQQVVSRTLLWLADGNQQNRSADLS